MTINLTHMPFPSLKFSIHEGRHMAKSFLYLKVWLLDLRVNEKLRFYHAYEQPFHIWKLGPFDSRPCGKNSLVFSSATSSYTRAHVPPN